jgi:predicted nucleic acid-binding protein
MMIVDTSGVLAYLDSDEPDHDAVRRAIESDDGELVMSPMVLAEADYMVARQFDTAKEIEFLEDVALGRYTLAPWENDDHRSALDVVKQYRDLDIGVADASNVVLANRHGTTWLLTLDQHYRAITPLAGGSAFKLLPADL